jgi:hypothetical protein
MKAGLLLRLAHLEMRESPPDLAHAFPEPSAEWWKEFTSVCQGLPQGAEVLAALGASADDIHTMLMGGSDAS